jgi:hypothetical protein
MYNLLFGKRKSVGKAIRTTLYFIFRMGTVTQLKKILKNFLDQLDAPPKIQKPRISAYL